jgi:hypothetical protein
LFAKTKLRAKYILDGKKTAAFLYISLLFLLRMIFLSILGSSVFVAAELMNGSGLRGIGDEAAYYVYVYALLLLFSFLSLYFYSRLRLARLRYFEKLIKGGGYEILYDGLKQDIKKTLRISGALIMTRILKFLWLVFYLSPPAILGAVMYRGISRGYIAVNVFTVLAGALGCAAFAGLIFYFCTAQRYMLTLKYAAEGDRGVWGAVRGSAAAVNGYSAAAALFTLSLLPWDVLCLWVVPAVYVVPYCGLAAELLRRKLGAKPEGEGSTKEIPVIK